MLYVVTATLNGLQYTQRLIEGLGRVGMAEPLRVVVIDNGSTDGTPEYLCDTYKGRQVLVVRNQGNTGVGAAWNLGIRIALLNQAEAVLVCGNDTVPMPGAVERLYALSASGVPFVTGTQVPYDEPDISVPPADVNDPLLAAPDFSFFLMNANVPNVLGNWDVQHEVSTRRQLGADAPLPAVAMNPWEWGLFDSRYFPAFFEDNDYHHRLQQAGILAVRDPGALFRHKCSATLQLNPDVAEMNKSTFGRNAELFKAKWGGYPQEVGLQQARPLNVTEEQWSAMSAGHPVAMVPQERVVAQARETYRRYGIPV